MYSCTQVGLTLHRMTTKGTVVVLMIQTEVECLPDQTTPLTPQLITSKALKYWSEEGGSGLID